MPPTDPTPPSTAIPVPGSRPPGVPTEAAWSLDVGDTFDLVAGPGSRWCSLWGPRGPCHPSIEGTADEWLAIADAIEGRRPHGYTRVDFDPLEGGEGRFRSPKNTVSERDHVRLAPAELTALVANIRDQLAPAAPAAELAEQLAANLTAATGVRHEVWQPGVSGRPPAGRPPGVPTSEPPRQREWRTETPPAYKPPEHVIEAARLAGVLSPCGKSKRGAAIFDPSTGEVTSRGCNHLPARIPCDGDEACRAACNRRCIHAETAAIVDAHRDSLPGCEIVHVKVVDDGVVTSGPPSCVPCAAMILRARLDAAWLLHEDGWRRYPADEFYRLSCAAAPAPAPDLRVAAVRRIAQGAVGDFVYSHARRLAEQSCGSPDDECVHEFAAAVHDLLNNLQADEHGEVSDGRRRGAPTFDINGDVNGPACGCQPGKLDPECSHQADQDARDADAIVRVLHLGFLPALRAAIDRAAPARTGLEPAPPMFNLAPVDEALARLRVTIDPDTGGVGYSVVPQAISVVLGAAPAMVDELRRLRAGWRRPVGAPTAAPQVEAPSPILGSDEDLARDLHAAIADDLHWSVVEPAVRERWTAAVTQHVAPLIRAAAKGGRALTAKLLSEAARPLWGDLDAMTYAEFARRVVDELAAGGPIDLPPPQWAPRVASRLRAELAALGGQVDDGPWERMSQRDRLTWCAAVESALASLARAQAPAVAAGRAATPCP
jgi:deoxycytidylate deaminase